MHRYIRRTKVLILIALSAAIWAGTPSALLEFDIHSDSAWVLLPVSINGKAALPMVLDTGKGRGVLINSLGLAHSLGLKQDGRVNVAGAGSGERVLGRLTRSVDIELSQAERWSSPALAMPGESLFSRKTRYFQMKGVIGEDVFRRYVVEVDFESDTLALHDPEKYRHRADSTRIPLHFRGDKVFLDARIRDEGGVERPIELILDTGASLTLSLQSQKIPGFQTPARSIESPLGYGISGPIRGRIGRLPALILGGLELKDIVTSFPDLKANGHGFQGRHQGLLGIRVLRRFHVVIDYGRKLLVLRPNKRFFDPFRLTALGLQQLPHEKNTFIVEGVIPGSPAALAGIGRGDVLTAVDGRPVGHYTSEALRELFLEEDREFLLSFLRNGRPLEVKVFTKRLV